MVDEPSKICFVIAPIGEPESDTRKRSDLILRHVIRPAVEAKGYTATRADDISEPGIITSQVIQHVVDDPLVVADLTDRNPNVFYELAVRHAIRKPFIQIINMGESIPFDVAATRTVFVDHHDLDNVETAKKEIVNQITALESDLSGLETPISMSLDLQNLRRSENPGERSLADAFVELSSIRSLLSDFVDRFATNPSGPMSMREIRRLEERLSSKVEEAMSFAQASRRRGSLDPHHIVGLIRSTMPEAGNLSLLPILLSLLREDFSWIYEVGMEGYRRIEAGNIRQGRETMQGLLRLIDLTRISIEDRPELHWLIDQLRDLLQTILSNPHER